MELKELPSWLAEAQALQTIEGNPLTDDELQHFMAWEKEGLSAEQMLKRLDAQNLSPSVVAAE